MRREAIIETKSFQVIIRDFFKGYAVDRIEIGI